MAKNMKGINSKETNKKYYDIQCMHYLSGFICSINHSLMEFNIHHH